MNAEDQSFTNRDQITEPTDDNSLSFHFQNLNLDETNLQSPGVEFLIEKKPIIMEDGLMYGRPLGVLIDKKSPKVENLLQQARQLKELPEEKRIQKVMEIVRSNVKYPYPETVAELQNTNNNLAEWINMNMVKENQVITLSDLVEKGYGVCRHLSVLYLFLAQEAGLKGAIMRTDPDNPIRNILRTDNKEPLFKLVEIGDEAPSHAWVEIQLSSNRWIPVDPSTNLIGDTTANLEMFNSANYMAAATYNLERSVKPKENIVGLFNKIYFKPGEPVTKGSAYIAPKKHLSLETGMKILSYQGPAELTISQLSSYTDLNTNIRII